MTEPHEEHRMTKLEWLALAFAACGILALVTVYCVTQQA